MSTTEPGVTDAEAGPTTEWREVAARIRNWGRWGDADELGTLNHITPDALVRATSLPRKGRAISLGVPYNAYGPQGAHGFRRNPIHLMTIDGGDEQLADRLAGLGGESEGFIAGMYQSGPMRFNDDFIIMPLQAGTQWDALSHVYYDGQLYNGYPASSVTSFGAAKDSIEAPARRGQVAGRGVLLDVARHRGIEQLEPNTVITPEELDRVADAEEVVIVPGDIVVVRTGWWREFLAKPNGDAWAAGSPGLSWRCAEWLHDRNAAAVASDNIAVEVMPPELGVVLLFHILAIRDMGMMLGEIWNLEELGADCASDGVYEFLLVAPALPFTGAVGSPLNPVAIK